VLLDDVSDAGHGERPMSALENLAGRPKGPDGRFTREQNTERAMVYDMAH
jgi:hypothetical protein